MAQYTVNRRRVATPEEEDSPPSIIPSTKDRTLSRHPRNSSTHQSSQYPDHTVPSSWQSYTFAAKQNHVLTKSKSLKHYKAPAFLDNLCQAKSMTLSADFDASSVAQVEPSRSKQQTRNIAGDSEVDKEIKKLYFKEGAGEEKVKVKTLHDDGKNDVYLVVKGSKGKDFKDPLGDGKFDLRRMSFGGGKRRSFCGPQVELRDFLANNGAKVVAVDMPPFMQIHAVDCARMTHDSLEKFSSKSLALTLKKEFDGIYGPAWHCIVGKSFGSFVTHSVGGFLYFSMDQKLYILLFKTTVQRAD